MKKLILILFFMTAFTFKTIKISAQDPDPGLPVNKEAINLQPIILDAPDLNKGMPLMQALKNRKSTRDFLDKKLSHQHLSEVMWAADGINREDGKRTAPSAVNRNMVDIYVVLTEGIYIYEASKHQLLPVAEGDFRKLAGIQDYVYSAPLNLVYVADLTRMKDIPMTVSREELINWACLEAGHIAENVYLYCASEELGAVTRALIDKKKFGNIIKSSSEQIVLSAQTVGYPK